MMEIEDNSDIILCFSGGLDSLIAYYVLNKPRTIYFNCSIYSEQEIKSVKSLIPNTIINNSLDLREFEEENGYIPHRNLLMASIASTYATNVVIAGLKDDRVPDKTPEAFRMMSVALTCTSKKRVSVISPFWGYTKSDVVRYFINNVPRAVDLIERSTSCYNNQMYCGKCESCFRKACALWDNSIKWGFNDHKMMDVYLQRAESGMYIPERNKSIIKFVKEHNELLVKR